MKLIEDNRYQNADIINEHKKEYIPNPLNDINEIIFKVK